MSDTVLLSDLDSQGVLTLTLNRPDKLNTLTSALLEQLASTFLNAKSDPQVRGVILTGSGKAFCAGADIHRLAELSANEGEAFAKQGQAIFRALETLGKPSIAAINGYALGGGCELAMSASLRLASETAKLGQPEVKLGVIPGYGGTQRLARLVGKGRAIELCLLGQPISANTAHQWGLVNHVCPSEALLSTAQEYMQTILSMGPEAIRRTLATIDHGYDLPLEEALNLEALQFGLCCASPEKTEGVQAFLEKRPPEF